MFGKCKKLLGLLIYSPGPSVGDRIQFLMPRSQLPSLPSTHFFTAHRNFTLSFILSPKHTPVSKQKMFLHTLTVLLSLAGAVTPYPSPTNVEREATTTGLKLYGYGSGISGLEVYYSDDDGT